MLVSGMSLTTWDAVPLVVPPLGVQAEVPPSLLELRHAASSRPLAAATIAIFHTVTYASLPKRWMPPTECTERLPSLAPKSPPAGENQVLTVVTRAVRRTLDAPRVPRAQSRPPR